MNRDISIAKVAEREEWDFIIIGGGASGMGVALDAASRGFSVLLLERFDFGKGTSGRSTKLIHGGVRYLAQGNLKLVIEALSERGFLLRNAPHLVEKLSFVIPLYSWKETIFYWLGLKLYDFLAINLSFGKSCFINKMEVRKRLPNLNLQNLTGGIVYWDGQFDDSRMLVEVANTCEKLGASILNYAEVEVLEKNQSGKITGLSFRDKESGKMYSVKGKAIINATGIFSDAIIKLDQPVVDHPNIFSQGAHLVFDKTFLPGEDALLVPKTSDGRVLFLIPWYHKILAGTTDIAIKIALPEPVAQEDEIEFILATAGKYLSKVPTRADILSVFAGQRPLVAPKVKGTQTKDLSRSHKIIVSSSNLITITGGKWTIFRRMGEDTVEKAIKVAGLGFKKSKSRFIKINGYIKEPENKGYLDIYGSNRIKIQSIIDEDPIFGDILHKDYPYLKAEVLYSVREEMARNIEDFLARRIRVLLLDAKAAMQMAPVAAELMAKELGKGKDWEKEQLEGFNALAGNYLPGPSS